MNKPFKMKGFSYPGKSPLLTHVKDHKNETTNDLDIGDGWDPKKTVVGPKRSKKQKKYEKSTYKGIFEKDKKKSDKHFKKADRLKKKYWPEKKFDKKGNPITPKKKGVIKRIIEKIPKYKVQFNTSPHVPGFVKIKKSKNN